MLGGLVSVLLYPAFPLCHFSVYVLCRPVFGFATMFRTLAYDGHRRVAVSMRGSYTIISRACCAPNSGTTVYLVTPFIGGGDLFDWVRQERRLPEGDVKPLFRQIVEAMQASKDCGLLADEGYLGALMHWYRRENT